jgi:ribosomal protein S18 acetylase RimI-like enzyme
VHVRPLTLRDIDAVAIRVQQKLQDDAHRNNHVNPFFSTAAFADALGASLHATWIAENNGRIVGHLYGALLDSPEYGNGAWTGPDGVSFNDADTLAALYSVAGSAWIDQNALEHYVWALDLADATAPWFNLGFARMHLRGVLKLGAPREHVLPEKYSIRRGDARDIDLAVALDRVLDEAQREGPSFSLFVEHDSRREDLLDALEDPEVHHYVVDFEGVGVAQCMTFPLDARRGSFDATMHLSAVAVRPEHQGRGIALSMVDRALNDARDAGFAYVETNWRITNRRAASFWLRYGFTPTYVRLHRSIASG